MPDNPKDQLREIMRKSPLGRSIEDYQQKQVQGAIDGMSDEEATGLVERCGQLRDDVGKFFEIWKALEVK